MKVYILDAKHFHSVNSNYRVGVYVSRDRAEQVKRKIVSSPYMSNYRYTISETNVVLD